VAGLYKSSIVKTLSWAGAAVDRRVTSNARTTETRRFKKDMGVC
jgi:hypothetical protein